MRWPFWLWCGLPAAAALALIVDPWLPGPTSANTAEFQHLTRGLGLGPAATLVHGARMFDLRLGDESPADFGPIPGGGWLMPAETMSILPLRTAQTVEDSHAHRP